MADDNKPDEFDLIATLFAPLSTGAPGAFGLTDDAALIDVPSGKQLVMTKDMMVAGVHFFEDDPADLIAQKLLRVNLSDLAAMGAAPAGYALGLGVGGEVDADWIGRFSEGLARDQAEFGLSLLGGDTVRVPTGMTLSLTAFGLVDQGAALRRNGARVGDIIYVTGTIGDAALGLLVKQGDLPADDHLQRRYLLPQPRVTVGASLADIASAGMDISDGLVADLGHLCRQSGVGAVVEAADIPLSDAAKKVLEARPALLEQVLTGGDDYELLFTASPENAGRVSAIASTTGIPITAIGQCVAEEGVKIQGFEGEELTFNRSGYNHFS